MQFAKNSRRIPTTTSPKIPVLLLTVFPRGREKTNIPLSAGMTTEADDYAQKPVSPEELLRRADELLKKRG